MLLSLIILALSAYFYVDILPTGVPAILTNTTTTTGTMEFPNNDTRRNAILLTPTGNDQSGGGVTSKIKYCNPLPKIQVRLSN